MHADDVLGARRLRRDVGDGQRGGVGRKDRVVARDAFDRGDHLAFEGEVLEHGLDDEVDVTEARPVGRAGDEVHSFCRLGAAHAAPLDPARQVLLHMSQAASDAGVVDLLDAGPDAGGLRVDGGDATSHEPTTEDADGGDLRRCHVGRHARVSLGFLLVEEDTHECRRLGGPDEPGELLDLGGVSRLDPLLGAHPHDAQQCRRGRVVAPGLGEHLLLGLAEQHLAPHRVLLECELLEMPRVEPALQRAPIALGCGRLVDGLEGAAPGDGEERLARNDVVDEPHLVGRPGPHAAARQHQIESGSETDEPGEALGAACSGDDAQLDLGLAELAVLGGDAGAAGERELQATAECGAVDGDHDGLAMLHVQVLDPTKGGVAHAGGVADVVVWAEGLEPADVGTHHEPGVLCGCDDDGAYGIVVLQTVEDDLQLAEETARQGIDRLSCDVDGDERNAIVTDIEREVLQVVFCDSHRASSQRSRMRAAPRPPAAHWVMRAVPASRRFSSLAIVSAWRAPVAAKG